MDSLDRDHVFFPPANQALNKVDAALLNGDKAALLAALSSLALGLKSVNPDNIDFYADQLAMMRQGKSEVSRFFSVVELKATILKLVESSFRMDRSTF